MKRKGHFTQAESCATNFAQHIGACRKRPKRNLIGTRESRFQHLVAENGDTVFQQQVWRCTFVVQLEVGLQADQSCSDRFAIRHQVSEGAERPEARTHTCSQADVGEPGALSGKTYKSAQRGEWNHVVGMIEGRRGKADVRNECLDFDSSLTK